jgi:hypothetical protein
LVDPRGLRDQRLACGSSRNPTKYTNRQEEKGSPTKGTRFRIHPTESLLKPLNSMPGWADDYRMGSTPAENCSSPKSINWNWVEPVRWPTND